MMCTQYHLKSLATQQFDQQLVANTKGNIKVQYVESVSMSWNLNAPPGYWPNFTHYTPPRQGKGKGWKKLIKKIKTPTTNLWRMYTTSSRVKTTSQQISEC